MKRALFVGSIVSLVVACSSSSNTSDYDGGSTTKPAPRAFGCQSTTSGCSCSTSIPSNSASCNPAGAECCADPGWPSSGSCACTGAVTFTCAVKCANQQCTFCRCGPGVTPGSGEQDSTTCEPGGTWTCCAGATSCNCGPGLTCSSNEVSTSICGGTRTTPCLAGTTKVLSCSGVSTTPTCPDKGFCSGDNNHCACGLGCIHLAAGSYTCGDSCSNNSDCTGKTDPQSGKPYTQCAMATYAGFCN